VCVCREMLECVDVRVCYNTCRHTNTQTHISEKYVREGLVQLIEKHAQKNITIAFHGESLLDTLLCKKHMHVCVSVVLLRLLAVVLTLCVFFFFFLYLCWLFAVCTHSLCFLCTCVGCLLFVVSHFCVHLSLLIECARVCVGAQCACCCVFELFVCAYCGM